MAPRLKQRYKSEMVPALMREFSYSNIMQVPRLEKIVVNVGIGEAIQNIKLLEAAQKELSMITGQKSAPIRPRPRCIPVI